MHFQACETSSACVRASHSYLLFCRACYPHPSESGVRQPLLQLLVSQALSCTTTSPPSCRECLRR